MGISRPRRTVHLRNSLSNAVIKHDEILYLFDLDPIIYVAMGHFGAAERKMGPNVPTTLVHDPVSGPLWCAIPQSVIPFSTGRRYDESYNARMSHVLTSEQILIRLVNGVTARITDLEGVRLSGYAVVISELNVVRDRLERALAYVRGRRD